MRYMPFHRMKYAFFASGPPLANIDTRKFRFRVSKLLMATSDKAFSFCSTRASASDSFALHSLYSASSLSQIFSLARPPSASLQPFQLRHAATCVEVNLSSRRRRLRASSSPPRHRRDAFPTSRCESGRVSRSQHRGPGFGPNSDTISERYPRPY